MAFGVIEKPIAWIGAKLGLVGEEQVVASAHFHSMAFWSILPVVIALWTGNKFWAFGSLPWGVTIIIAESGSKGRWIDIFTRATGALVGFVLGMVVLLK